MGDDLGAGFFSCQFVVESCQCLLRRLRFAIICTTSREMRNISLEARRMYSLFFSRCIVEIVLAYNIPKYIIVYLSKKNKRLEYLSSNDF